MISRIKEVIAYYKLTDRAFAIKCGIKQNTLSRQLNGVSEISVPTINAILDNYDVEYGVYNVDDGVVFWCMFDCD